MAVVRIADVRVTDQPAFILHRRDFRDSSLILDVFTLHYGRLSVVARGARKRRDSSVYQPFNRLSLGWTGASDLKTLTAIDAVTMPLAADCYLAAYYVNELLLYLMPLQDPNEAIFRAYQNLLLSIDSTSLESCLREFELDLLNSLGLMPDLLRTSDGDAVVDAYGFYRVDCENGVMPSAADDVAAFAGQVLLKIEQRLFDDKDSRLAARRLMRQIIDFNLNGRTLQSRKLYQQMNASRHK